MKFFPSSKYKSVHCYLYFTQVNDLRKKAAYHCLCKYVGERSEKYLSKKAMSDAKDDLYGADLDCSYKLYGNLISFCVHYSFLAPRYSKDVTIDDYADFFKEVLLHVAFDEDSFHEYQRILIDANRRRQAEPSRRSYNDVIRQIASKESSFAVYDGDYVKELEEMSLEDVKDVYEDLLRKAMTEVYVYGDLSKEEAEKLDVINEEGREICRVEEKPFDLSGMGDTLQTSTGKQSYLYAVYTTPFTYSHESLYAWMAANALYGVVPTSFLFEEIREKEGLCYNIVSIDFKPYGLVIVRTEIDKENRELVKRKIEEEREKIARGSFDDTQLLSTKRILTNALLSIRDDLSARSGFYHLNALLGREISPEEYIQKIEDVKKEEVMKAIGQYTYAHSAFYEGEEP